MDFILAIDQGTSSTRCIIFDKSGTVCGLSQKEHRQIYPHPSWVEHDANEIRQNVLDTMSGALKNAKLSWKDIRAIGITNQRETIVAWDKKNGKAISNAIVWQCRRTTNIVNQMKKDGYEDLFHKKTGLVLDAYFSGTKAKWMLDNINKIKNNENLAFGTIDSWIINFLTGNHRTDASNASRTLLYDINRLDWSDELCEIIGVPIHLLPEVIENADDPFGYYEIEGYQIPITGVLGDQQAALFGQTAFNYGDMKTTYGTGNFSLLNIGDQPKFSKNGLLTTIGWQMDGKTSYALEGSVFITGAAIKWLRDGLQIIDNYSEIDKISSNNSEGVYFVPAFVGLGAPHWDSTASGTFFGISGGTTRENIIHATLDSIAFQTNELIDTMSIDTGINIKSMSVDGGSTRSHLLMQKQADISQIHINIPNNIETTALGVAFMAGYKLIWDNLKELKEINPTVSIFKPILSNDQIKNRINTWGKAVQKSKNWY